MTFRTKVLMTTAITVGVSVLAVAWAVSTVMTRHFEFQEQARTEEFLAGFEKGFAGQGREIGQRLDTIAASSAMSRLIAEASGPQPDYSPYVHDAENLAREQGLDFLELIAPDRSIISSAQWPARFSYKEEWLAGPYEWNTHAAFLRREDLAEGPDLALIAVRTIRTGDSILYISGGRRVDQAFLRALHLPPAALITLYRNFEPQYSQKDVIGSIPPQDGPALIQEALKTNRPAVRNVRSFLRDLKLEDRVTAVPLRGLNNDVLAVLLVGNSRVDFVQLTRYIRQIGLGVGVAGVLIGIALSWWASARVSRPIHELSSAVREVAQGNWSVTAPVRSNDEIGALAAAFNQMTRELIETRERTLQAERVAAWRELARRLAHELKNPLFPLQITVENLQRARVAVPATIDPAEFDEIFHESTGTLLAELDNLKTIIGRFSDFAKMPAPQLESVDLNRVVREVMSLFDAQLRAPGRPAITASVDLEERLPPVQADPEQIRRALRNLVLNALDAMPGGGSLALRTMSDERHIILEVSDTGQGMTPEECERLFTPYYTTKQHGTGLGLAIVQSVVSDHHGSISVHSTPAKGTTFRIELRRGEA
jgi:two-component system nitrogen regulation sensor histidine kinase NtrY